MSDFDFEELDQAINDLYEALDDDGSDSDGRSASSTNESSVASSLPVESPSKKQSAGISDMTDIADAVDKVEPTRGVESATPAKPKLAQAKALDVVPAKRIKAIKGAGDVDSDNIESTPVTSSNKGHFMDMVHPSSDISVQHKPNFAAERQRELQIAEAKARAEAVSDAEDSE